MAAPKNSPKDAQVMAAILKDMGVTEYEPRLVHQMLEFTYRYVTDILDDAKVYANHANKKNIDVEDVKLAIQCRLDHSFTTPPPRDLLMDVARHKNNSPLPLIKPYTGPKLPPDRYCLAASNYRLKSLKKSVKVQLHSGSGLQTSLVSPRISLQHGASKLAGSSIVRPQVNVGSLGSGALTIVTRGMTQPTVTIRQTTPAAQTTPVPLIRFTPGSAVSAGSTVAAPTITTNLVSSGGLKRKREDDDDYDKP